LNPAWCHLEAEPYILAIEQINSLLVFFCEHVFKNKKKNCIQANQKTNILYLKKLCVATHKIFYLPHLSFQKFKFGVRFANFAHEHTHGDGEYGHSKGRIGCGGDCTDAYRWHRFWYLHVVRIQTHIGCKNHPFFQLFAILSSLKNGKSQSTSKQKIPPELS
jgi:hypothetical protein